MGHEIGMTWTEAESWCRQNNAYLASFASAEERVSYTIREKHTLHGQFYLVLARAPPPPPHWPEKYAQ